MFKAKDKNGQQIFLKDIVQYVEMDLMGEAIPHKGVAIAIPSEEIVEVQDIEGGIPCVVNADSVIVLESLVQQVVALSTVEELQELLTNAEARYNIEVEKSKKKRGGGRSGTRQPKAKPEPVDMSDVEIDVEI
jgi:hypothetical protein